MALEKRQSNVRNRPVLNFLVFICVAPILRDLLTSGSLELSLVYNEVEIPVDRPRVLHTVGLDSSRK